MAGGAETQMVRKSEGAFGEQTGIVELLWGLRERPSRGPKPALSVERIARTAMDIADADGLQAVSMQRVAGELDFTKMSLYRYLGGKDELIAAMIEVAVGEPPDLEGVPGGWRSEIEEWVRHLSASWQHHPWLPWATMGHRVMGPNEVGWIERAVGALAGTGLSGGEQMDAVFVLCGHLRNTQTMTAAGTQPWTSDKQFSPAMAALLYRDGDRYPALTAAISSAAPDPHHDNGREFGLRRILDGLEKLIAERSSMEGPAHSMSPSPAPP
jgi:AcrR family transcriptional regulator